MCMRELRQYAIYHRIDTPCLERMKLGQWPCVKKNTLIGGVSRTTAKTQGIQHVKALQTFNQLALFFIFKLSQLVQGLLSFCSAKYGHKGGELAHMSAWFGYEWLLVAFCGPPVAQCGFNRFHLSCVASCRLIYLPRLLLHQSGSELSTTLHFKQECFVVTLHKGVRPLRFWTECEFFSPKVQLCCQLVLLVGSCLGTSLFKESQGFGTTTSLAQALAYGS